MEGEDDDALLQAAIQLSLAEAEQLNLTGESEPNSSGSKRSHEDTSDGAERGSPDRTRLRPSPDGRVRPLRHVLLGDS